MLVQVIHGKVKDPELLRRQSESWLRELKPGATGYLGSTGGITEDGRFITIARFESAEAAKANSDRPEQGEWWNQTAPAFDGEVAFHDCTEADTVLGGGSDDAGFVQIIQGRAKDQDQLRARMREFEERLRERRPDLLGILVAWHGDGGFTQAAYFRSEEEARTNEKATEQDDARQEFMSMLDGPPTFLDLREPQLD